MNITPELIIEIGKVISAIVCIAGIPLALYKVLKRWSQGLFDKIDKLEDKINSLKTEVENMKGENNRRFNEINDSIKDMRGTSRTFYSVLNTLIEVMYKKDPSKELDGVKKQISNELIAKATKED